MDYPTADEEFELQYGDELEMMDEFDGRHHKFIKLISFVNISSTTEPENIQVPIVSKTQKSAANNKQVSILSSPALSQISRDGAHFTPAFAANKKTTSTPFVEKLKAFQFQSQEPFASSALNEIQNIGVKRKRQRLEGNCRHDGES